MMEEQARKAKVTCCATRTEREELGRLRAVKCNHSEVLRPLRVRTVESGQIPVPLSNADEVNPTYLNQIRQVSLSRRSGC